MAHLTPCVLLCATLWAALSRALKAHARALTYIACAAVLQVEAAKNLQLALPPQPKPASGALGSVEEDVGAAAEGGADVGGAVRDQDMVKGVKGMAPVEGKGAGARQLAPAAAEEEEADVAAGGGLSGAVGAIFTTAGPAPVVEQA